MIKCHVFNQKSARVEDLTRLDSFSSKPAVPPLTTEPVVSVIYLVDDDELQA